MNEPVDLVLAQWLVDGPDTGTREGLTRTLELTLTTKQWSRWRFPFAWLPMGPAVPPVGRAAPIGTVIVVALLALALVVAALAAGSRPRLPAPYGIAGNGLIAVASRGAVVVSQPDGASPRRLAPTGGVQSAPAFSPSGDRIAFWSLPTLGPPALIVAAADGSGAHDVLGGAVDRSVDVRTAPAWSPDGTELAFITRSRPTSHRLLVARADGGGVRELRAVPGVLADPAWSPTGEVVAVRRTLGADVAILTLRRDGSGERVLVNETVAPSEAGDAGGQAWNLARTMQGFQWSPDGTRIAYTSSSADVKVVDLQGEITAIGSDPTAAEVNPAWSASGSRLAYYGADGTELVIVDLEGTDRQRLPSGLAGAPCAIAWSPDERRLLASAGSSTCPASAGQLMVVDLETGVRARLPDELRADGLPSWQRVAP